MSGPVAIRPVVHADLPGFHAVMMAAGMDPRSSWNRTTLTDLERSLFGAGSGGFIAVSEDAQVVGCVGYRPDGAHTLTLNKLATLPEARGQGIGRLLVEGVEAQARRNGYVRVLLAVSQFNQEVIPFYRRLGYVRSEEPYAHAHPASQAPVVFLKSLDMPA